MNSKHDSKQDQHSHLFLVRFWNEETVDREGYELRGKVQHVLSGEARSFDDWAELIELLLEMAETERIEARVSDGKTIEAVE